MCDDNFTVPLIVETAELTVVKTASPDTVSELGGTVTYDVQVTNDADFVSVELTTLGDDVYDDLTDPANPKITNNTCVDLVGFVLGPDETASCSFDAFVSGNADDVITDVVTVCGDQSNTGEEICGDDFADVTVTDVLSEPALAKTALSAGCTVDVNYRVVVSNDTDSPDSLTVNSLTDDKFGNITQVQGNVISTTCATGAVIDPAITTPAPSWAGSRVALAPSITPTR